jgi:hypothetical protein
VQTEQFFGEFDECHVIDDPRCQYAARAATNSDTDEALVNGLYDDERRSLTALASDGEDPEARASRQVTVAEYQVEASTLVQRLGEPARIPNLNDSSVKGTNNWQYGQFDFLRASGKKNALVTRADHRATLGWFGRNETRFTTPFRTFGRYWTCVLSVAGL